MTTTQNSSEIQAVIDVWQPYINTISDWQALVQGVTPKVTGCGPIYDLPNPIDRQSESFAIADMRQIKYAQPHYHTNGEVEIYFVLQGSGKVVVGNKILPIQKGSVVATPSEVTHYTIPDTPSDLVLVVINTPPFNPANNIDVTESDPATNYDHELFKQLTSKV